MSPVQIFYADKKTSRAVCLPRRDLAAPVYQLLAVDLAVHFTRGYLPVCTPLELLFLFHFLGS